ncbi:DUF4175 family protein [Pseudoduganella namucuonensis]|uniref:DUF4175 family protein n=1 Tax=Pseudoduganella namucuonensis TaxID=1035707 RepID=A0A1I7LDP5_9BURK|nr:DUF4175 family protein [Pseudoduganella namucuonensis]SFV07694.1 protein of unknown function [Pseudoduganella namucuonensis]
MSVDADFRATVQRRLWRAFLLRRAPLWALVLLPPLLVCALTVAGPRTASQGAAGLPPFAIPLFLLGVGLIWLILDLRALRRRLAVEWPRWLDAAFPALEDSSELLASEPASAIARLQRKRLQARLLDVLNDDGYRAIARTRVRWRVLPLILSLLAAGAAWALQQVAAPKPAASSASAAARPAAPGELTLRVTPPAYTKAAAFETAAKDIQIPQYSDVRWCFARPGEPASAVELSDGQSLPVARECAAWKATESVFWRARHLPTARHNILVTPDQPPRVAIAAPKEAIHLLAAGAKNVQLSVSTRDDYGIVRASLHMTLARGSGENIRFSDKEMPLPQSNDPRGRQWQKNWSLEELGMEPGDELYFFVRATDNAPEHPHTVQSPTYTLRLPGPQAESLDATALPTLVKPENLRSQRQIIIDTEQLVADMPKLGPAALRARSEAIAGDQAKLRLRYGQFLGEESTLFGDDEHGPGDSHDHGGSAPAPGGFGKMDNVLQRFGHAHDEADNATIFDPQTKEVLRRALKAMWEAEKQLRAIAPKPALPPEYKALAAIKELQQAERVYLHRTAFVPPAIKEEKRMSGDVVGAQSYKRAQGAANDVIPQDVRELVQSLGAGGVLPALWSKTARDVIAARIANDEQKLAAQRAVQDVADGCHACRDELRAWLRGTLTEVPVVLQARPRSDTKFGQAWRGKEQP